MTFQFKPAVRQNVSLLIGIAGSSGSGKTYSALSIATGLAGPAGRIAGIDTEAGRMLHYADQFKFDHGDLRAPFSPDRYIDAIAAADEAGYDVIVIDSMSHEWESEGGCQQMHDDILDEQVETARRNHRGNWQFDEDKTRERLSVGAWKKPKKQHKKFVARLLQCRAHLVMCLRADEKMRIEKVKDDAGRERTVFIQAKDLPLKERWSPICERRFPYELGLSLILTPQQPGVPVPVKLQEQHREMVPLDRQLSIETGAALAEWARGGVARPLVDRAADTAALGRGALKDFYRRLTPTEQKSIADADWKRLFADADAADAARSQNAADDPPAAKDAGAERPATAPASDRLSAIRAIAEKGMDAVHDWRETASADDLALFDDHASEIFSLAAVADQKNAAA